MQQDIFWFLLSKKLAGEASQEELKELENFIAQHPDWHTAIQNMEDLWNSKRATDYLEAEDAYLLHMNRMKESQARFGDEAVEMALKPKRVLNGKWWFRAAAASIIFVSLVSVGWIFFGNGQKKQAIMSVNEISTRHGSKSKVELPDGSVVWLNVGSKLTYTKDYGKEIREVTLTGEGYFDVMKMKEKPFIIHTSTIKIKVLGTVFNVKAYPDDKLTETSLIHGKIEVTINNRPNDKIILSPNEKLVVENEKPAPANSQAADNPESVNPSVSVANPLVSVNKLSYNPNDSTLVETEWVNNRLVFRNETFEDVTKQMERWYNVSIEIDNTALKGARLNGIFEHESITQALEALKEMIPFHYKMEYNKIIIHQ